METGFSSGLIRTAFFGLALVLCVTPTQAQTETTNTSSSPASDTSLKSLTGCLRQDKPTGEFKLLDEEGGVWTLQDESSDLWAYGEHTVSVTGIVSTELASSHNSESDTEHLPTPPLRRLIVLSAEKLSDGCQLDMPVR